MVLRNQHGQESRRYIRMKTMETQTDGDKTISVFDRPRDVKGTALLTYTHKTKVDDQWMYLPALKRVKRISSTNKSGPFMGSEFAYEDISSTEFEKYTYRYLEDTEVNGRPAYILERDPVDVNSGYSKQHVVVDQADYRVYKIDYYDRKGALLKTQLVPSHQLFLERFWRPLEVKMINHVTGKSTDLIWKNYTFRSGLTDKSFTRAALKRVR